MAERNGPVIVDIMNLLETEPDSSSSVITTGTPHPNFPALRDQLAILVSTGKGKEVIGVQLIQEQVKRLSDKDVEKYTKRYETF